MSEPAYLRFPSTAADLVSFAADDDVWVVPATGGRAWRVSADSSPVTSTRLSPDGSRVAWTSACRAAGPDVRVAAADGGPVTRLTWDATRSTTVAAWLPGDELAVSTDHGGYHRGVPAGYAVPAAGGPPRPLPWGDVGAAAVLPADEPRGTAGAGGVAGLSAVATSTPMFGSISARKRYRGGTAARLWLDTGAGFVRQLPEVTAPLVTPVLASGRVGFTSDLDGVAQLWSAPLPGDGSVLSTGDLTRHTDAADYVRHAACDGRRVVWVQAGSLWVLDDLDPAAGATPRQLEVTLGGPRSGRARHRVAAKGAVRSAAPDRTGRAAVLEVRGTVQWLPVRDGPVRALAAGSGVRRRLPVALGDTGRVSFVTDAEGADAVEVVPAGEGTTPGSAPGTPAGGAPVRHGAGALGDIEALAASPDGAVLAVTSLDGRLSLLDATTGAAAEVVRAGSGPVTGAVFSPDSGWLAWSEPGPAPLRHIRLVRLAGGRRDGDVLDVTGLRFTDSEPVFTRDGCHLAFLSARTFDPVHDSLVFDRPFPPATRPYLVPLAADTPSPFDPSGQGRPADSGPGAAAGEHGSDPATPPATRVDPDGIADRLRPAPVRAGDLSGLAAVEGGLVWLRATPAGDLGASAARPGDDPERPVLERVELATGEVVTLSPGVDAVRVSDDGRRLLVRDRDALAVLPADTPAPPGPDAKDRVALDLGRVAVEVDPPAEWAQMYDEAGRRMRSQFWRADVDGVDWDAQLARYRPLLDAVATRDDLVDVMLEVGGELATSHVYVIPDPDHDEGRDPGLLGAELARDDDGTWRVAGVLPGESSDPRARSPLLAPAVDVRAGDALLAVGGRAVEADAGPGPLLVGTADSPVELTVRRGDGAPRTVTVVPVGSETQLRYHAWVADRRARTRELSGGRLGYLHVPDMVENGWAQLHRDLRVETTLDGLVVDTRDNGGGELSQLVVEKIARRVLAWDLSRSRGWERYPYDAPRGPVVVLADQYAGSDGDIVNAAVQQLGVGPVVGQRTWGGVIGYDEPYPLVGGVSVVQPCLSFVFGDSHGWGVENHGVDPDVEVAVTPAHLAAGDDPQLERAVSIALERLADTPAAVPPELPPARRGGL